MLKEFEIIEQIFQKTPSSIFLGIGDDAALFEKNKKEFWAASQDTLNINTHFLSNTDPENLGWKSLAVNVSDILSMGGNPKFALLSLSIPSANQVWIKKFRRNSSFLQGQYRSATRSRVYGIYAIPRGS